MRLLALALTAAVSAAAPVYDWSTATGEHNDGFEESKALCRAVREREPPRSDQPDASAAAALAGCDSEALYYGIGRPADPVKARQCAFLERDAGDTMVMGGTAMLMTVYANGVGAKRDLDVATHLACGIEGAPFENHGRVMHLAALKKEKWSGSDFHFCDDITSGLAMGYCAGHGQRIAGAKRVAAVQALTRGWTPAERAALAALTKAENDYVEAHAGGEVDMAGTARAAMAITAEEAIHDEFVAMLTRLSAAASTSTSADDRAADGRLNAAYRRAMAAAPSATSEDAYPGAVTREGIRDAQRAWLRYRDAFLALARVKHPSVAPDGLAAWLTEQRTRLLRAAQ